MKKISNKRYVFSFWVPIKIYLIFFMFREYVFADDVVLTNILYLLYEDLYMFLTFYLSMFVLRLLFEEKTSAGIKNKTDIKQELGTHYNDINPFLIEEMMLKKKKTYKFCSYCDSLKYPRTQHCFICNRCYNKQFTHSNRFGSCIFFMNHKFFLIFHLLYIIHNIVNLIVLIVIINDNVILVYFFIIIVILELLIYIYNTKLYLFTLLYNETTKEKLAINNYIRGNIITKSYFIEGPIDDYIECRDRKILNPYFLGFKENFYQVFGRSRFIHWITCKFSSEGNGISFQKNTDKSSNFETTDI